MPRARSRSSASARLASSRASPTSSRALSGSRSKRSSAMPRSIASATSRACAPSCRSRSIRCSSAAATSTAPDARLGEPLDALGEARREHPAGDVRLAQREAALDVERDRDQHEPDDDGDGVLLPGVDVEPQVRRVVRQRPPPRRQRDAPERVAPEHEPDRSPGQPDDAQHEQIRGVLPGLRVGAHDPQALAEPAAARNGPVARADRLAEHERDAVTLDVAHRAEQREREQHDRQADDQDDQRDRQRHGGDPDRERDDRGDEAQQHIQRIGADLLQPSGGSRRSIGGCGCRDHTVSFAPGGVYSQTGFPPRRQWG